MNNDMNNYNNNVNNPNVMYNQVNNQPGVGMQPQQPMMQPQMNYQQAPVYQQPQPPVKKKNDLLIVFIIIGVVIALIITIVLLVFSNGNDKDKENNNDNNEIVENQDDKNEENDNENKVDKETDDQPENNDNNTNDEQDNDSNDINNNTSTSLPNDWKSMQFIFDGKKYSLISPYTAFKNNGWELDLSKLGNPNGYVVKPNTRVLSTIQLYNSKYTDSFIMVGFINSGTVDKDITECDIWSFGVRNTYSKTPISFELPGGIKNGSTHAEVEAAYGKLEEKDIYRSESLKYTTYNYSYDFNKYLKLTVYDDGGVKEFSYKVYG